MNEDRNNENYNENGISLRELIMALWKRKKMIISLTLIASFIAGIYSVLIISPVYDTKVNIVINMPAKYNTRYGEYTLPISTNEQYLSLIKSNNVLINTMKDMGYSSDNVSLENLQKRINIGKPGAKAGTVQNSFEVAVSAKNPDESLKLAQSLFSNYLKFIDAMTKERAVNYYYNYFYVSIKSLENSLNSEKENLKSNGELLAQTPKTMETGKANLYVRGQLNNNDYYAVPFDTVNPNYLAIERDTVENKQKINSLENSMQMHNKYLAELDLEKQAINKYYKTGEAEKFESVLMGVVETHIYLPSPPVAPMQKTGPNNTLNVAIGLVLGAFLGIMIALFQEYWYKDNKSKKNKVSVSATNQSKE